MKRIFYIFIFIVGFQHNSTAQVKSSFITDESLKAVKFYPNPAVSIINFEFQEDNDKSLTLLIFNFIGKKVMEVRVLDQKMTIPLTGFYRGVYIFQLRDKQGNIVESGKFQVIN